MSLIALLHIIVLMLVVLVPVIAIVLIVRYIVRRRSDARRSDDEGTADGTGSGEPGTAPRDPGIPSERTSSVDDAGPVEESASGHDDDIPFFEEDR